MDQICRNYAELVLKRGVNIQPGQVLVIDSPMWAADFDHLLMEEAFKLGAKDTIIHYADAEAERLRVKYMSDEALCDIPRWMSEKSTFYADEGAAFLRVISPKPGAAEDEDPARAAKRRKALSAPLAAMQMKRMANDLSWSAVCIPNPEWACQVYPDKAPEEAVAALWEAIYRCCYVTQESGTAGWDRHIEKMLDNVRKLNALDIRTLHLKNAKGTDITLDLCEEGVFAGGICHCPEPDGILFAPNIPTEEILTTPHRFSANGTVYNTLPLVYNDTIIDDFHLTFKDGVVVDWACGKNAEVLAGILNTDEGSRRLGEIALVPYDSPIRRSGVLFYNTLFDENASCHMALGAGYIDVLHGKDRRTEALVAQGLNLSSLHVDFMFGSADMCCTATTADGCEVPIFRDGVFVI